MNWLEILNQIFNVCLIPLLGLATTIFISFIKQKILESKTRIDNDVVNRYLLLFETTVVDCIKATNQTYVDALKDKNAFDKEAQTEALKKTTESVKRILSDDAKKYLSLFIGDLEEAIKEKIEANIKELK